MTNDEKAYEICQPLIEDGIGDYTTAEIVAITMAEWKDWQFKEYLEKKREGVRMAIEKCSRNTVKEYSLVMVREYFDEIINELFGE